MGSWKVRHGYMHTLGMARTYPTGPHTDPLDYTVSMLPQLIVPSQGDTLTYFLTVMHVRGISHYIYNLQSITYPYVPAPMRQSMANTGSVKAITKAVRCRHAVGKLNERRACTPRSACCSCLLRPGLWSMKPGLSNVSMG